MNGVFLFLLTLLRQMKIFKRERGFRFLDHLLKVMFKKIERRERNNGLWVIKVFLTFYFLSVFLRCSGTLRS